jgi:prepilin-type processing-associated H-X9-DG protein
MKTIRVRFSDRTNPSLGFSLLEVLAVLAVTACVCAILVPAFVRYRESSHLSTCSSNERQLAIGLLQYSVDNDACFPASYHDTNGLGWGSAIFAYVKSPSIFKCPDDRGGTRNSSSGYTTAESYAINPNVVTRQNLGTIIIPLSQFADPGKTVLLTEVEEIRITTPVYISSEDSSPVADGFCGGWFCHLVGAQYATGPMAGEPAAEYSACGFAPRHGSGANFAYVDGHVKWLRGIDVSIGGNADPKAKGYPNIPDSADNSNQTGNAAPCDYTGFGLRTGRPFEATYSIY